MELVICKVAGFSRLATLLKVNLLRKVRLARNTKFQRRSTIAASGELDFGNLVN